MGKMKQINEQQMFKWGVCVNNNLVCQSKQGVINLTKCLLHFGSFSFNGITVKVGDFVCISNSVNDDDDDDTCFVAEVLDMYDNGKKADNHIVVVRWYWRYEEVPVAKRKLLPHPSENERELYKSAPGCRDSECSVEAETIYKQCEIMELPLDANSDFIKDSGNSSLYFTKFVFTGEDFIPVIRHSRSAGKIHHSRNDKLYRPIEVPSSVSSWISCTSREGSPEIPLQAPISKRKEKESRSFTACKSLQFDQASPPHRRYHMNDILDFLVNNEAVLCREKPQEPLPLRNGDLDLPKSVKCFNFLGDKETQVGRLKRFTEEDLLMNDLRAMSLKAEKPNQFFVSKDKSESPKKDYDISRLADKRKIASKSEQKHSSIKNGLVSPIRSRTRRRMKRIESENGDSLKSMQVSLTSDGVCPTSTNSSVHILTDLLSHSDSADSGKDSSHAVSNSKPSDDQCFDLNESDLPVICKLSVSPCVRMNKIRCNSMSASVSASKLQENTSEEETVKSQQCPETPSRLRRRRDSDSSACDEKIPKKIYVTRSSAKSKTKNVRCQRLLRSTQRNQTVSAPKSNETTHEMLSESKDVSINVIEAEDDILAKEIELVSPRSSLTVHRFAEPERPTTVVEDDILVKGLEMGSSHSSLIVHKSDEAENAARRSGRVRTPSKRLLEADKQLTRLTQNDVALSGKSAQAEIKKNCKRGKPAKLTVDSDYDNESSGSGSEASEDSDVPVRKMRNMQLRTPKRKTPKQKLHKQSKPSMTPSLRSRTKPTKTKRSALEEARVRLHVSAVPESLPCREREYADIYNFVEGKLLENSGGCMYISGVPGTGKTATVHEVIRSLLEASSNGEVPEFTFVELNGMRMTEPHQVFVQLLKALTGFKATAHHAASLLDKRFSANVKREAVVVLVDELDLLMTRKQDVMYNLFEWPSRANSGLTVLAIANTMDLPERVLMKRVSSRLGLTRMTFAPYSHQQLEKIVASRMQGLDAFDRDAIQFAARKVAALSGDARRALDICRRATEMAEQSASSKCKNVLVGMSHVEAAVQEMNCSPMIVAVRSATLQEKTFLQAIVAEFQRTGLEEASFSRVSEQHAVLCRINGYKVPNMCILNGVMHSLASHRLLLLEGGKNDLSKRIRLNLSVDDVTFALKEKRH